MTNDMDNTHLPVTFLLDKSNNWIEPYLYDSGLIEADGRFTLSVSHDHTQVIGQQIVFILGYTRILDETFLSRNRLNLVVHESNLPSGRGFSPVQWQVLEGKKVIPVCLIEATEKVDAGDVVGRAQIELDGYELYDEIREKQAKATFDVVRKFLGDYPNFSREPQRGAGEVYARRTIKDSEVNIDKTIREQFDLLRLGNNEQWPSHFYLDGRKFILKIYRA